MVIGDLWEKMTVCKDSDTVKVSAQSQDTVFDANALPLMTMIDQVEGDSVEEFLVTNEHPLMPVPGETPEYPLVPDTEKDFITQCANEEHSTEVSLPRLGCAFTAHTSLPVSESSALMTRVAEEHYNIHHLHARTVSSELYLACDRRNGNQVLLKIPSQKAWARDAVQAQKAMRREYLNLHQTHHRNLISLYEHEKELLTLRHGDDRPTLVLPFHQGKTLDEVCRQGPLRCTTLFFILDGLCAGVRELHSIGLIHRDLKDTNIIILKHGHIVIVDLGISTPLGTYLTGPVTAGSDGYLDPSLLTGRRLVSARTDVYAMAAVLVYMLTGKHPWPGRTSVDIQRAQFQGRHRIPDALLYSRWGSPLLKALSPVPADRYPTIKAFEAALYGTHREATAHLIAAGLLRR